jgi:hypothetical protein
LWLQENQVFGARGPAAIGAGQCEAAPGDELGPMVRAESEIAVEVEALLAGAERIDAAQDAADGPDRRGDELPAELTRRQGRLAAIRKARPPWRLSTDNARAQAEKEAIAGYQDPGQVSKARDVAEAFAVVPDRAQRSFTDPDARIRKTSDGLCH